MNVLSNPSYIVKTTRGHLEVCYVEYGTVLVSSDYRPRYHQKEVELNVGGTLDGGRILEVKKL